MKRMFSYGLTALIGGMSVRNILHLRGFHAAQGHARLCILADAFTVPGVVLTMLGAAVLLSRAGAFDGLSYAAGYAWRMLIPGRSGETPETYGEHVRRRENREKTACGSLFWVGGLLLLAAIVFTALFLLQD